MNSHAGRKLGLLRERIRAKVISVVSVRRPLSLVTLNLGSRHESNAEQGRRSWSVGMKLHRKGPRATLRDIERVKNFVAHFAPSDR